MQWMLQIRLKATQVTKDNRVCATEMPLSKAEGELAEWFRGEWRASGNEK